MPPQPSFLLPLPTLLPLRPFPRKSPLVCNMTAPPTTSAKRLYKTIDSVSISYTLQESTTNTPPLLCLHGFGASSFSFQSLFHHLPNRTLLSYDAPAFGHTSRPSQTSFYTPAFSATVAKSLLKQYSHHQGYAVLAHSMGALAAARLRGCSHLILIAPALLPGTLSTRLAPLRLLTASFSRISALFLNFIIPLLIPLVSITLSRHSFWKAALSFSRHPTNPPTDAIIKGYKQPLQHPGWEKGLLKFSVAALRDRSRALRHREDFVADLGAADCKILIIHGEDDPIVPLDNSVRLAEKLHARLVVMEACGHVPHEERPQLVANYINDFLNT